ncbi:MAG TPA: transglycosylase SLT domain-containing protein [Patescibacteria group bacterium]|nr:transglycosylase SLT domain-containing protein [Patescibacteria group bacterium]
MLDLSQFNSNEFVDPTQHVQQANIDAEQRMAVNAQILENHAAQAEMSAPVVDPTPAQLNLGLAKGTPTGSGTLGKFLHAIASQESGGNYNALGVVTRSGDRAYGKYQVMGANVPSWTKAALGKSLTPQQYLHSPRAQEAVARYKLSEYFRKYGPAGAAKAWYAGEGNARTNSDSPQYGGPSINDYAASVLRRMG